MPVKGKVLLSVGITVCVVITIWLVQPKHLRELDTKGPGRDMSVWECTGAYCTGPGL